MNYPEEPKTERADAEEDHTPLPVRRGRKVQATDPQASRRGLMLVIPLVMAAAAVTALALGGMKDNAIYLKPIDEVMANKTKFAGRPVRAEGNLVHGTLVKRDSPCEYRFTIEKKGVQVPVRYAQCVVPDTFRDVPGMDVGVTVEGELQADNSFEATSVLAKCPSKYEMQEKAGRGEKMPHLATDLPKVE